jgi:hypothetical protein
MRKSPLSRGTDGADVPPARDGKDPRLRDDRPHRGSVASLPPRTPAQLLTALAANPSGPALSGTVVETASLGLPALPPIVGPISLSSFLAGSHVIKVWYDTESDLVRDGSDAWLWGSSVNMVPNGSADRGAAGA